MRRSVADSVALVAAARWVALLGMLGGSSGCDDPLTAPQQIQDNRVLAARVEALADPTRAQIAPGESARVRWLVADPDPKRAVGWAFSVCPAEDVSAGLPRCAGPSFAEAVSSEPNSIAPEWTFGLPSAASGKVVVLGAVCAGSQPVVTGSPWDARCSSPDSKRTLVHLYVSVWQGGEPNHNPDLSPVAILFDGALWEAPGEAMVETDCDDLPPGVPRVPVGSRGHTLQLTVPDGDREPLVQTSQLDPARESLLLSHFATGGELARAYSALDPEQSLGPFEVRWDAPGSVPAAGLVVRFYLVLRDLRGGTDFTARALCVVP